MLATCLIEEEEEIRTPAGNVPLSHLNLTGQSFGCWFETHLTSRMRLRLGRYPIVQKLGHGSGTVGRWYALVRNGMAVSSLAYLRKHEIGVDEDLLPAAILLTDVLPDIIDASELVVLPGAYLTEFPEEDLSPLLEGAGLTHLGQIHRATPFPEIDILIGRC